MLPAALGAKFERGVIAEARRGFKRSSAAAPAGCATGQRPQTDAAGKVLFAGQRVVGRKCCAADERWEESLC